MCHAALFIPSCCFLSLIIDSIRFLKIVKSSQKGVKEARICADTTIPQLLWLLYVLTLFEDVKVFLFGFGILKPKTFENKNQPNVFTFVFQYMYGLPRGRGHHDNALSCYQWDKGHLKNWSIHNIFSSTDFSSLSLVGLHSNEQAVWFQPWVFFIVVSLSLFICLPLSLFLSLSGYLPPPSLSLSPPPSLSLSQTAPTWPSFP